MSFPANNTYPRDYYSEDGVTRVAHDANELQKLKDFDQLILNARMRCATRQMEADRRMAESLQSEFYRQDRPTRQLRPIGPSAQNQLPGANNGNCRGRKVDPYDRAY